LFVPDGFDPPSGLETDLFRLEPLGPQHNERDYEAWSSSIEHIRASPGYGAGSRWPRPMSLEENLADLSAFYTRRELRPHGPASRTRCWTAGGEGEGTVA
jgi:hypothetical protein